MFETLTVLRHLGEGCTIIYMYRFVRNYKKLNSHIAKKLRNSRENIK